MFSVNVLQIETDELESDDPIEFTQIGELTLNRFSGCSVLVHPS